MLEPGLDGNIVSSNDAIASFDGFDDPLDLVENPTNGFLYVSQFDRSGGQGTITLLRPQEPNIVVNKDQLIFDEVRGGAASAAKTITVSNTGNGNLTLSNISITGTDAALFSVYARDHDAGQHRPRRLAQHQRCVQSARRQCRSGRRWPTCTSRRTTPTSRRSISTWAA